MALLDTSVGYGFPMDSHVPTKWVNGLPVYDRAYNASDLRRVMSLLFSDGVFIDCLDELEVRQTVGSWCVGPGVGVAGGLIMPVEDEVKVLDQSDVPTGQYAFVCIASRLDSANLDFHVYARVSASPSIEPMRTDSGVELVLARIDWRGTLTDLRLDNSCCGPVTPLYQPDTDSFMSALKTAVSQFDLNVGTVESLPSGSTPTVTVRKPVLAGGEVYVDFGIPRGAPGEPGRDGESAPTCYVAPDGEEPPRVYGNVWFVDDRLTHTITGLRSYETDRVYPGDSVYPDQYLYPGGTGQWVSHKLAPSIVASA